MDEVMTILGNVAGHRRRGCFPVLDAETIGEMAALPVAVVGSQGSREFFGLGRAVEFFREGRCKCITRQIALHMSAALVVGERSEEHTSELQSLMRISYAVFCLKKKKIKTTNNQQQI